MSKTKIGGAGAFFYGPKYFPVGGLSVPLSPRRRQRKKDRKKKRKERLATIFTAAVACLPASQPGSQPVHHEASHPASKQANRSISFSGATGMGPSNATKQRATVLHHFPSERPSRPQPLITRHCQSAATEASTTPASLLLSVTAFSHYTTIIQPVSRGGFYFSFQECQQKGPRMKKLKKTLNKTHQMAFLIEFHLTST